MDIVYAIWLRSMKRFIRSRSGIVGSILMPFFVLIFLGVGLNNVVTIPGLGGGDYFLFLIPGMVTMSVMFSAIGSGVQILWDRKFGFLKETLVAPVTRLEIMAGQTAGGATNAVLQGCCLLIPALLLLGLEIHNLAGVAVTLVFMVLIGFGFTAFGIAIASRTGDSAGFQLIMNFVMLPIFGLSGAIFPISSLPSWAVPFTLIDPLTYGVEGMRYGLTGVSQIHPAICIAVIGGFCIAATVAGAYLFRKMK
jgi:ABC-type polysaccharide/polyol phosphate export systems, permease component